jgi:hypothetical protein
MAIERIPAPVSSTTVNVSGQGLKYEVIQSITLTTGTTITFSNIPSKYRALKLLMAPGMSASTAVWFRVNGNSNNIYSFSLRALAITTWATQTNTAGSVHYITSSTNAALRYDIDIFHANIASFKSTNINGLVGSQTITGTGLITLTDTISSITIGNDAAANFTAGTAMLLGSE